MTRLPHVRIWIREELWERRKLGETLSSLGRRFGVSTTTVWHAIARVGGIAPRPRRCREQSLRLDEREEISRLLASSKSLRFIATRLGRPPSTISREVARNGGIQGYRAVAAATRAAREAARRQPCKLAQRDALRAAVVSKLEDHWSPQQISRWLRRAFADDAGMQVSHEAIYRTLYVQTRGTLRKELTQYLRTRRAMRRPRGGGNSTASIVDGVSISERPADVEDRAVPGHWEGDLLMGSPSDAIVTLVERKTRYVMLLKIGSKDTKTVTTTIATHIQRLPDELRKSLTWDRGSELSAHKQLAIDAGIEIYFCDPSSPWQRGSNENTNGLLRQYFPKGERIGHFDQAHLDGVARQLNGRPRETLGWYSPAEVLAKVLQ